MSKFRWALSEPGHGHFIEQSRTASIAFDPVRVCEPDQASRNTMQTRYSTPFIFESIDQMSAFCSDQPLPSIQGYYARLSQPTSVQKGATEMKIHEQIVQTLKARANLQLVIFEFGWHLPTNSYSALKHRLRTAGWLLSDHKLCTSEHFSDRVSMDINLIIGLSNEFYKSSATDSRQLAPKPSIPCDMNPNISSEFNKSAYAVPYVGELFDIEELVPRTKRRPSVEYVVRQSSDNELGLDIGFQVYNTDYPAPRPELISNGLFGSLFGISFINKKYSVENNEPKT